MYDILLKINSQGIGVFAKGRYSVMKRHQWKPLLLICLLLAAPVSAAAAMGQTILDDLQDSLHRRVISLRFALRLFTDKLE